MLKRLIDGFYRIVLCHPFWVLLAVLVLLVGAAYEARYFDLDASADSLLLKGNQDYKNAQTVQREYGSTPFVFVTFTPSGSLFTRESLDTLDRLRGDLTKIDRVQSVTSMLDVPLVQGSDVTFTSLADDGVPTLRGGDVSLEQAKQDLTTSPLYKNLVISEDAQTTAMLLRFKTDPVAEQLRERLRQMRVEQRGDGLDENDQTILDRIQQQLDERSDLEQRRMRETVGQIRDILDRYRDTASIHLGGVPMIAVDMIDYVRNDIRTFGIGIALFIVILLALLFRRVRWVLVPSLICAGVVLGMIGWTGLMRWPVTVVSSNFISLVLIITLGLVIHLIVRYREVQANQSTLDQRALLRETISSKFKPSVFTSLTTALSFASLMLADIKPVMDFGLMMFCSVVIGFLLTFVMFPALLAWLKPMSAPPASAGSGSRANVALAHWVQGHSRLTGSIFLGLLLVGIAGSLQLTVENRFIDYFHEDSAIYQGLSLIDRKLGGTTPLDVVIDAPESFMEDYRANKEFNEELGVSTESGPTQGYWFNQRNLERVVRIQDYLESLDATGKVLSIGTAWEIVRGINDGKPLEPYELGILYNRAPKEIKNEIITPYMSSDGNQIRINIRVIDSLPGLQRNELLKRIRTQLTKRFELAPQQVQLSGLMVLYDDVLQSLYRSQIATLGIMLIVLMVIFGALYRSWRMAIIGPLPTSVAAVMVLGLMGWVGLPLDIMTMTIAAIVAGIGVNDTIHYVDRVQTEVRAGADHLRASRIGHEEVGVAMVYTSVIVALGFSILMLSNFMPSVYFGLLTGVAMLFALICNLMFLPVLVQYLKPFGRS